MSTAIANTDHREVAAPESGSIISMIARAASDPAVSIDKMERLFSMHQQMEAERRRAAFQSAMAQVQAEIEPVVKDRDNNHTKSRYATLEAVDDAIRPLYTSRGFSLSFDSETTADGKLTVFCDALHSEGHLERKSLTGSLDTVGPNGSRNKTDIQGLGSSTSYLRRYLTCMIFNVTISNEDRDGNATAKTISGHQYAEIVEKLALVNGDHEKFASLFRVANVADIPARCFDDAIRKIEERSRKLAQERGDGA